MQQQCKKPWGNPRRGNVGAGPEPWPPHEEGAVMAQAMTGGVRCPWKQGLGFSCRGGGQSLPLEGKVSRALARDG